ncbi:hypothetical protein [Sphingomonas sp.]|uniref:hypothetical protein n=1 Tax=Sphingomonas sp. TaxID=28214 RepID=UPI0025E5B053|nr:hypothetical protein [Sphingomonas sp.]
MLKKIGRLFTIKTKWEAYLIIYSLATGSMERGKAYLVTYPGYGGWLLMAACSGAVFLGGAKILDAITMLRERSEEAAKV